MRQALEQALAAMRPIGDIDLGSTPLPGDFALYVLRLRAAIRAAEAALAEPAAEPAAWVIEHGGVRELTFIPPRGDWSNAIGFTVTALYAEPRRSGKMWLWRNFVDGKPEYWAFDNPFPIHLDCGDPQTLGEPCGYAIYKPSRRGRTDVPDEDVLRRIRACLDEPAAWRTFDGEGGYDYRSYEDNESYRDEYIKRNGDKYATWIKPLYAAPPARRLLTDEELRECFVATNTAEPLSEGWPGLERFARAVERAHGVK